MKRLYCILLLLLGTTTLSAQSWDDILKELTSGAATELVDQLTGGKLTATAIQGTWNYKEPAVRFESDDMISNLGSSAIESTITPKLEKAYQFVGIKAGAASFSFRADSTFTATLGKKELKGTYTFDPESHTMQLSFDAKLLSSMSAKAYIDGAKLQLVFPVNKLLQLIKSVGSNISYLQTIIKLLENYENVYLGFGFERGA